MENKEKGITEHYEAFIFSKGFITTKEKEKQIQILPVVKKIIAGKELNSTLTQFDFVITGAHKFAKQKKIQ